MKKILIVPYFGKFPNYFQLFLNSCEKNFDYNWLIFTDDKEEYRYPRNVEVIEISFKELKNIIQKKFPFKISLETPYKLCDFKPSYGYIFEEYIKGYDFWGHCDIDLIFGDLNKFISNKLLEKYEKLFILGHFTLYKNTNNNNKMFMCTYQNDHLYKNYFTKNGNFIFDELFEKSINNIYEEKKIGYYDKIFCADIYTKSSNFRTVEKFDRKTKQYLISKYKSNLFIYDNGKIFEYYRKNNKIEKKEYMYIHLQKRKMKVNKDLDENFYKIIPNSFERIEYNEITNENFKRIKIKNFNLHYFRIRFKNLKVKLERKFGK